MFFESVHVHWDKPNFNQQLKHVNFKLPIYPFVISHSFALLLTLLFSLAIRISAIRLF